MPNRNLTPAELEKANELLSYILGRLDELGGGDSDLLFAYRRKVAKELVYKERGKPSLRTRLKAQKHKQQGGRCAECKQELPIKYSELDRKNAADGYTVENTELVHAACHQKRQAAKAYT